jgi:hypothetical protein
MADKRVRNESVEPSSPDLKKELLARLREAAPDVFSEGKLDLEKLTELVGDGVASGPERFSFCWAGKREAIALLQNPTRATLLPVVSESVDFEAAQHVFIEGDNLEVLKLLYRSYFGRVKMIYIDPPYNTGNEFIYPDDFSDPLDNYLRLTGQRNGNGDDQTSKLEKSGRIHSNWLSMMYPRLALARQSRNAVVWRPELLPRTDEANARYENLDNDERGPWKPGDLTARNYYSAGLYEVSSPSGKTFKPSLGTYWRVKHKKFLQLDTDRRIWWGVKGDNMPQIKRFLSDVKQGMVPQTLWKYEDVGPHARCEKGIAKVRSV